MRRLFKDYESYFGPAVNADGSKINLSLQNKDLAMTEYVRHPAFQVHGVSMKWEDEPRPRFVRARDIQEMYAKIDWADTHVIAHNTLFEGLINYEVFGVVPGRYSCTMAMAEWVFQGAFSVGLDNLSKALLGRQKLPDLQDFRGIRTEDLTEEQWQKLARYADNDVELAAEIYEKLAPALPKAEHELMNHTLMLFANPVLEVDVPMAREALEDAIRERDEKVVKAGCSMQQISGNKSFEQLLRSKLGWVPTKVSPTNGKTIPAFAKTDIDFVSLKVHPDEAVRNLVEARLEVKSGLNITRAQRMIDIGTTGSRMFNVCLHFARAHTLRWTGGNKMNPQNNTRGSKVRKAILAPADHRIVKVDSSQIECRAEAVIAGQQDLVEQFESGEDVYATLATEIYGYEVNKRDHPDERFMGKTARLGLGYYMGWRRFYNEIVTGARHPEGKGIPIKPEFAQRVVEVYRHKSPQIVQLWDDARRWIEYLCYGDRPLEVKGGMMLLEPETNRIIFPNGCFLRYPGLTNDEGTYKYLVERKGKKLYTKLHGGIVTENITQAIARHMVAHQILAIGKRYRLALFVHDECVYLAPIEEADEALEFGLQEFRKNPFDWIHVPLDSEGWHSSCYEEERDVEARQRAA